MHLDHVEGEEEAAAINRGLGDGRFIYQEERERGLTDGSTRLMRIRSSFQMDTFGDQRSKYDARIVVHEDNSLN